MDRRRFLGSLVAAPLLLLLPEAPYDTDPKAVKAKIDMESKWSYMNADLYTTGGTTLTIYDPTKDDWEEPIREYDIDELNFVIRSGLHQTPKDARSIWPG